MSVDSNARRHWLKGLAALVGGDVALQADPLLHQEQFDVVAV